MMKKGLQNNEGYPEIDPYTSIVTSIEHQSSHTPLGFLTLVSGHSNADWNANRCAEPNDYERTKDGFAYV